jgi:LPS export ABC transporter protein LptC
MYRKTNLQPVKSALFGLSKGCLLLLLLTVAACQQSSQIQQQIEKSSSESSNSETRLILNNATLEQADDQGQILWKIRVKMARYSQDSKRAELEEITGNLFQEGKLILKVSAKKGEIEKDGDEISLRDKIVATDVRNGIIIKGENVKWKPKDYLLVVEKNLIGIHRNLTVTSEGGIYYTKKERLELRGNVLGNYREPKLQMKTDRLYWNIPQETLVGDRPIQIVRYKDKTVTDQVIADQAEVGLKNSLATLRKNVEFKSLEPPLQMATNSINWQYENRTVNAKEPIRIVDPKNKIIVTGNQGELVLSQKIARLRGGVAGESTQRNQAKIYAREVLWNMPNNIVEAAGNVIYQQSNPNMSFAGSKAVGKLTDNSIVVTGEPGAGVVTKIVP